MFVVRLSRGAATSSDISSVSMQVQALEPPEEGQTMGLEALGEDLER